MFVFIYLFTECGHIYRERERQRERVIYTCACMNK